MSQESRKRFGLAVLALAVILHLRFWTHCKDCFVFLNGDLAKKVVPVPTPESSFAPIVNFTSSPKPFPTSSSNSSARENTTTDLGNSTQEQTGRNFHKLSFLHIPKTGSTFIRDMIQHQCPTQSAEEVREIFGLILKGRHAKKYPCASSIKPGHAGLKASTPLRYTVTMVRNPFDRLVSGFLHNLHDCPSLQNRLSIDEHDEPAIAMKAICEDVSDEVHTPHHFSENKLGKRKSAREIFLEYAQCVRGCSQNMILGGNRCKIPPATIFEGNVSAEVDRRIQKLAYVGVTDEWDKSVCLWRQTFPPRKGGSGNYLPETAFGTDAKFRSTPLKTCRDDLKQMIRSNQTLLDFIQSDPDWSVFARSVQLLEQRLPEECRHNNT